PRGRTRSMTYTLLGLGDLGLVLVLILDVGVDLVLVEVFVLGLRRRALAGRLVLLLRDRRQLRGGSSGLARLLSLAHHAPLGRDDHHHPAAFHVRRGLDRRDVGAQLDDAVEHLHAGLRVRDLAAAEHHREPDLVAALEEAPDMLHLEVHVVLLGLGPELDFLGLDLGRALALLLLLLRFLVLVLAVIHDPADRRKRARRDLDQIEALFLGEAQRLVRWHDAKLLFLEDDPDLRDADAVVDAQALLGAASIETSRRPAVHWFTSLMLMCLWDLHLRASRQ